MPYLGLVKAIMIVGERTAKNHAWMGSAVSFINISLLANVRDLIIYKNYRVYVCLYGYIFIVCGDGTEGTGPSCIGNKAAPNCAKKDKVCKCGLKTAAVTSCASKKSAPVCFKNGILPAACSCGDQGNVYSLQTQT